MTRGYTSTEFWSTLLTDIIAILALFHVGMPANTQPYVSAIALLASGIATAIYTHSRQQIKVASINSTSSTPPTPTISQPIVTIAPIASPVPPATVSGDTATGPSV